MTDDEAPARAPLEIFRVRCEAWAHVVRIEGVALLDAILSLQADALRQGLDPVAVRTIMTDVFASTDENRQLDKDIQERDVNQVIAALAEMSTVAYAQRRRAAGKELGIPLETLDKLVAAKRAEQTATVPLFEHWNVEPWPDAVDTGFLLSAIVERVQRHVVMSADQAVTVALWVMLTWVHHRVAVHSPILFVTSPTASCGKSTLLDVIGYLVRRWLPTASITSAALFRSIEKWAPTFVIDEGDTVFVNNEDLRAVVNSGWTRGQYALRYDPDTAELRVFPTFAPKAIGMKGRKLPDTTLGRTIIVELKPKLPSERAVDFGHIDDEDLARLRRRLARWANDSIGALLAAEPEVPPGFHNRVRANWRPLLAIADQAGGEWAGKARLAAGATEGIRAMFEKSDVVELLADIKEAFGEQEALPSASLVGRLAADPDRAWATWNRGKPMTQRQLARLLSGFSIRPDSVRVGLKTPKGYYLRWFEDAFLRHSIEEVLKRRSGADQAAQASPFSAS